MGQNVNTVYPDLGSVRIEDFHPSISGTDSNAAALVLEDIGKTELEGYERGWRVKFMRYRRILIRNKNGFDAAKVSLTFSPYRNDTGKLATLYAITNNAEDGKVVRTKVESADMFLERNANGNSKETFTFPNVKPGSIIEYTYSIYTGNIYSLHSWDFQGEYPCLRSEYSVTFPQVFNYVVSKQGAFPLDRMMDSVKATIQVGSYSVKTMVFTMRWALKDIPAVVDEPFVSSVDNYISGIRFQLSEEIDLQSRRRVSVLKNWETLNKELYHNSAFGGVMTATSHWERRELRAIVPDSAGDMQRARAVFAFVRDHFLAQGRDFIADDELTLKDIFKARRGSVAEINLLLTALLREEGLSAEAVILSTKDNGILNPNYPLMENFNYVVVRLRIGGKDYFLDATQPRIGFGKLPLECYNGYARVIGAAGDAVNLSADSLQEFRFKTVFLSDNETGDGIEGNCTTVAGYYGSGEIRDRVEKDGEDAYFEEVRKSYPFDVRLKDKQIDSLKQYDEPVTVRYSFSFGTEGADHFYFNPMLSDAIKENPFAAAERHFPINMPYTRDELYVLQMDIPKGYEVEELPKPIRIRLNEDDGSYEYNFLVDSSSIQVRSKLLLKRTSFQPEEYRDLRDFFSLIVKKQSEPIVFRKKK